MTSATTAHDTQPLPTDRQWKHIGESQGCADHDHDLLHDLSRRLDALWRYDQFIANAEGRPPLESCWRDFKAMELDCVGRLKALIRAEVESGCF